METDAPKKKVLVLNGSPHKDKSSTMVVTRAFLDGLTRKETYEAETISVAALKVTPCMGCLSCWGRTEGECVIRGDDVAAVKEKILAADLLLLSFPLYFFGVPGQMKLLGDRLLSMMKTYCGQKVPPDGSPAHGMRYPRPAQKILLISGCAYVETGEVYQPTLKQCDLICGKGGYTAVLCPQLKTMLDNGGTRVERTLARFRAAGEEFERSGALSDATLAALTRPPFSDTVYKTILAEVWRKEREEGEKARGTSCD